MSRGRRILLAPGYLLHHLPYRDTSRILEVLTREHGRLTLFARGVRGPKSKLAPVLQPFQPLLLSWSGRGEAAQLAGAELSGAPRRLPAACLMAAFYLSELILKLTTRHDPHPALFDAYHRALESLKCGQPPDGVPEETLRLFEKRLLEEVGYGLDLATESPTGCDIEPGTYYQLRLTQGLVRATADAPGAVAGSSVLALARERLTDARTLADARRLLKAALDHCLEGRELATRAVARSLEARRRTSLRAARHTRTA